MYVANSAVLRSSQEKPSVQPAFKAPPNLNMSLQPWNTAPGRSIDIELGGQEVINIELDTLDANADDVVEVLKEGRPKVSVWTRLAGEYLRRGHLDAAEKIAKDAVACACCSSLRMSEY